MDTEFDPALVDKAARRSHPTLWRDRNKSPEHTMAWEHHLSVTRAVLSVVAEELEAKGYGEGFADGQAQSSLIWEPRYRQAKLEGAREVYDALRQAARDGNLPLPTARVIVERLEESK